MQRLNSRADLAALRGRCAQAQRNQSGQILVCAGTGCVASGSLAVYDRLRQLLAQKGVDCCVKLDESAHSGAVGVVQCGCHGFCEMGVLIRIEPQGWLYTKVTVDDCEEIVTQSIIGGVHIPRLAYTQGGTVYPRQEDIPFYKGQTRVVLEHCGHIDATHVQAYLAVGGYAGFEKALFDMDGPGIVREVSDSGLRGRGGGGFPAGRKWDQVRRQPPGPRYIVCNGDEGDPGAFMDRSIMEGDPHRMIEGMMIAAIATGADTGYIYVRAEYPLAVERLRTAIDDLTGLGLLGRHILGTDFSFTLHINRGAGAFVCGEGSALTASIEGRRGMPRVKPPRTVEHGLFDKPTVLGNVESFANVPAIITRGAAWLRTIGTEKSPGTKAFALTGNIRNTGLIEVPMGATLREVIFDIGGGMPGGADFKAVQIGGPSGGCLTAQHLDLPLDFDSLKKAGAMIGSGGLVVMDSDTCMVEVARFFMNFTQNESCGKCVPCREGTRRMRDILERIVNGEGQEGDIDLLLELAEAISATALCGLGKAAAQPVVSTIQNFREEYEAHILEKRCPTGQCQALRQYAIDAALCRGCTKCARVCPVGAISGSPGKPFVIDRAACVKCGACEAACPFKAITVR